MTRKQCWQYKCDFCGKVGYSAGHMARHEVGCTMNPNRTCRIHKHADVRFENPGPLPVSELIAHLRAHGSNNDHGLEALRELAEDCPCCIFAAIRQIGWHRGYGDEDGYTEPRIKFDFKAELKRLWDGANERSAERVFYG
jgi:hypothetical protein